MKVSFRHRVGINNFSSYKSFNLTLLRGATGTPIARTSRTKKGVGSGAREGACSLARCGLMSRRQTKKCMHLSRVLICSQNGIGCVVDKFLCDGDKDCDDGSDEMICSGEK